MPWGASGSTEQLWCVGCGVIGSEFRQRRRLDGPAPTPRVRTCAACYERGWRLLGPGVEVGEFWMLRSGARAAQRPIDFASEGKTA